MGSTLRQYDISSYIPATIQASEFLVDTFQINVAQALRLYNGKVYSAMNVQSYIGCINSPNVKGVGCSYQRNAVALLSNTKCNSGLSAEAVLPLPKDTTPSILLDTLICSSTHSQSIQPINLRARSLTDLYIWDNGSTDSVRQINKRGKYWVFYKGDCHSYVDSFLVGGSDFDFDLGADTLLCDGGNLQLSVIIPGESRYLWQNGDTSNSYTLQQSGTYTLSVTKNGCTLADSVKVIFPNLQQELGDDITLCSDIPISINLSAHLSNTPGTEILWSTGEKTASIMVKDTGIYWIEVVNQYCISSDTIRVKKQVCNCTLNIPTGFSPNGDGHNDVFLPLIEPGCLTNKYILSIYNRWGQRLFSTSNPLQGWDGKHNGVPAELGTYFYSLQFEGGIYKRNYYQKGDIVLVR